LRTSIRLAAFLFLILAVSSMLINAHDFRVTGSDGALTGDYAELWPGTHPEWDYNLSTPDQIVKMDYPKSTILVDTVGDLLFRITIVEKRYGVMIYIPPEFGAISVGNVWTSVTNDYNSISVAKLSSGDLIGPDWWLITIEPIQSPNNETRVGIPIPALDSNKVPPYTFYVRVFSIKAPSIAGRYFFKIFRLEHSDSSTYTSIGAQKFPTIVVKGEVDPAYISGTILYGGSDYYGYYYGRPIDVPGKVIATGITPTGRLVRAQAYFNATANGRYTLYGLAPATYNLTVSAAGMPPVALERSVTVLAGQSLDGVDMYLHPGARVNGKVWSKNCMLGNKIPWNTAYSITVTLYDMGWETLSYITGTTDANADNYNFTFGSAPFWLVNTDFTGQIPQDYAGYVSGLEPGVYYVNATVSDYAQMELYTIVVPRLEYTGSIYLEMDLRICPTYTPPSQPTYTGDLNVTVFSVDWQNPAQKIHWAYPGSYVKIIVYTLAGGAVSSLILEQVPDKNYLSANFTGLSTGVYTLKAFTPGYVQLITPEVAVVANSTADISFELVKGAAIFTIINFKTENLLAPVDLTNYTSIRIEVYDSNGKFVGVGLGYVPPNVVQISWPIYNFTRIIGFDSYAGNICSRNYGNWVNYYDTTDGVPINDYGLSAGTYTVKVWVPGYMQRSVVTATVTLSGNATVILDLHRMAHVYGRFSETGVRWFNVFGELYPLSWAQILAAGPTSAVAYSIDGDYDLWLPSGTYTISVGVPLYQVYQPQSVTITVTDGSETSLGFNLVETGIPIPEFSTAQFVTIVLILTSLLFSRRLKKRHRILLSVS